MDDNFLPKTDSGPLPAVEPPTTGSAAVPPLSTTTVTPPEAPPEKPLIVQATDSSQGFATLPPSKPKLPVKPILLGFVSVLIIGAVALTVYFLQKGKFPLFFKAQQSGQLVCEPVVPDTANGGCYKSIKATNNTTSPVHIVWQYNFCSLPVPATACPLPICTDQNTLKKSEEVIGAGESKTYTISVPCEFYGQLDIYQNKSGFPGEPQCTHPDGTPWNSATPGGPAIAFTFSKGQ